MSINLFANEPDIRSFAAGSYVFKENEESGNLMFAVLEGQVELRKGSRTLMVLGPEGIFGEMAILEEMPRSADAVAVTDCRLAAINQKRLGPVFCDSNASPAFGTIAPADTNRVNRETLFLWAQAECPGRGLVRRPGEVSTAAGMIRAFTG